MQRNFFSLMSQKKTMLDMLDVLDYRFLTRLTRLTCLTREKKTKAQPIYIYKITNYTLNNISTINAAKFFSHVSKTHVRYVRRVRLWKKRYRTQTAT